ncbi:trypsin-like serine protease [Bacillus safensis]|uniref:trypsin-like serine peptidase n=1 Tax=Bacillus safensis TaxID=561879 RepID=UPI0023430683|nr:trypsin-like serine protease [Bacillus safensis]WCL57089.1 trypsin-like serine protease [Bacillus safensis]
MDNICKLIYKLGESQAKSLASASIIIYKGEYFIATAAHCLYDLGSNELANNISIEVENQGKKESYEVQNIVIPEKWISTHRLTYDYAFGRVKLTQEMKNVAFIPKFDFSKDIEAHNKGISLAGYPISLFKTQKKYSKGDLDLTLFTEEQLVGMRSKLKHGISGGPWFFESNNGKFQFGVTSARINSFKNMVWASVWTKETERLLNTLLTSEQKLILV